MKKRGWAIALAMFMLTTSIAAFTACGEKSAPPADDLPEISVISDLEDDRYTNLYGRTFYNEGLEGMTIVNSASGFDVRFRGTSLSMSVQAIVGTAAGYQKAMFSVFVDGSKDSEERILNVPKAFMGMYDDVTIVENLPQGEHTVKVLKRTPSNRDRCIISELKTDGVFLSAPERPALKLDVYGDSITCGEGVLREATLIEGTTTYRDSCIYTADTQDVFLSYAGVAARELDAEFNVFGRGGITMSFHTEAEEFSVLNNYKSMAVDMSIERGDCPEYDYSSFTPDAVVIYLGTNDHFRAVNNNTGYTLDGLKYAFVDFINRVVETYYGTDTPIFLCSGMMAIGSGLESCMDSVVQFLQAKYPNLQHVQFAAGLTSPTGGHPIVEDSDEAGKQLAAAIRTQLGLL